MSSTDLGWLTGSSVLPKKRHYIHKVSGRSLFGLRAALYKEEESSKYRWKRRRKQKDETRNPGVEQRAAKDTQAMTVQVTDTLEKKASLYQQLCEAGVDEDSEYMVDFERKYLDNEEQPPTQVSDWMVEWKVADSKQSDENPPSYAFPCHILPNSDMETYRKLGAEEWNRLVDTTLWWKKHGFLFGGIPKEQVDQLYPFLFGMSKA